MIVLCLLGFKLWQSDLVVDEVKDPDLKFARNATWWFIEVAPLR
jgi:hypothetical protein